MSNIHTNLHVFMYSQLIHCPNLWMSLLIFSPLKPSTPLLLFFILS